MDLLKLGAEVKVYSRSQGRLCPAKIIGLEGDLSQHQLAKSGEKIGRGWVEVKYMPPCPSITKNVKIGDIKYDPSLLPSPPREEAVRRVQRDSRNPCIGVRDGTLHPGCPQERPICMKSNCSERTVDSARERRKERRMQGKEEEMGSIDEKEEEDMEPEPKPNPLEMDAFYKLDHRIVQYKGISILRHGRFHPEIPEGEHKQIFHFQHYEINSGELRTESIDKEESEITQTLEKTEPSILCPIIIEDENNSEEYEWHEYINFNTTSKDLKKRIQFSDDDIQFIRSNAILFVYPISDAPVSQRKLFNRTTSDTRFKIISAHTNSKEPPFDIDREWGGNLVMDDGSDNKTLKDLLGISTDGQSRGEILELLKRTLLDNLFFIKKYSYQEILFMRGPGHNPGLTPTEAITNFFYKKHFPESLYSLDGGEGKKGALNNSNRKTKKKSKKKSKKRKHTKKRKRSSRKSKTKRRR